MRAAQDATPWKALDIITQFHCRTCLGDDAVEQFVEDHADTGCNVVLLGAGYDTRFYRLPLAEHANLFEVDAKGTQDMKLDALNAATADILNLDRVTYVSVDFQSECWFDRLVDSGMCKELPTIIIWEGVTYYLPQEVVEKTLSIVAKRFDGTAAIFFDYYHPTFVEKNAGAMKGFGEPFLFGIESEDMSGLVTSAGLQEWDHLSVQEVADRCMPRLANGMSSGIGSHQKYFMLVGNAQPPYTLPSRLHGA